jgi:ATP-dependent HslUV protease subunit HslV
LLLVADRQHLFLVGGDGNVIQPDDDIASIGSGGPYALAAARALRKHTDLPAATIVRDALMIAGEICIYTNTDLTVLELQEGEAIPSAAEKESAS